MGGAEGIFGGFYGIWEVGSVLVALRGLWWPPEWAGSGWCGCGGRGFRSGELKLKIKNKEIFEGV